MMSGEQIGSLHSSSFILPRSGRYPYPLMTVRASRLVAILALVFLALLEPSSQAAQTKKKKSSPRRKPVARKAAPRPTVPLAVGTTFEERLASLVNGKTAQSSDTSIQIVDLESGRVIAER